MIFPLIPMLKFQSATERDRLAKKKKATACISHDSQCLHEL